MIKKGGDVWIKPDRGASIHTRRLTDLLLDVRDEELAAVAGLSRVVNCNFDCHQLSDAALEAVATLSALDHLALIRAKFSADGLARLKALPKLAPLDFVDTNFTGMLSRFHELPRVYHLTLSYGCRLSPAHIEALAAAKSMSWVALNDAPLGDEHVAALSKLTRIKTLDLAGTGVTAPGGE